MEIWFIRQSREFWAASSPQRWRSRPSWSESRPFTNNVRTTSALMLFTIADGDLLSEDLKLLCLKKFCDIGSRVIHPRLGRKIRSMRGTSGLLSDIAISFLQCSYPQGPERLPGPQVDGDACEALSSILVQCISKRW